MAEYDVVIVGSGPNGFSAGITLQKQGIKTLIIEGSETVGGGMRSEEYFGPGLITDTCSSIHPLAIESPYFKKLPLQDHGLEWLIPPYSLAHPLSGGGGAVMEKSLEKTAGMLGEDRLAYLKAFGFFVENWDYISNYTLGPFRLPARPILMAKAGMKLVPSAKGLVDRLFRTTEGRALFGGIAAHSMLPLTAITSAAIGFILGTPAHLSGWGFPKGGAGGLQNALESLYRSLGGEIETGRFINSGKDLPPARAYLFDTAPSLVTEIFSEKIPASYKSRIAAFNYGPGVFKVDYLMKGKIPWKDERAGRACTVHVGGTFEEILVAEDQPHKGRHSESPFVLVAQPSYFDPSRTSDNKFPIWAYCHVPNGSEKDMSLAIEKQIERFAPGFRDLIEAKRVTDPAGFESYNPNYKGGDINGGLASYDQLFTRPVIRRDPYATPLDNVFLCSSSTPPGGGVHGMCGYHAAQSVLKKIFRIN